MKNYYITLKNEEWRVEKSKKSISVEGRFLFCGGWNFSKSVSVGPTFIREMRVPVILATLQYLELSKLLIKPCSKNPV